MMFGTSRCAGACTSQFISDCIMQEFFCDTLFMLCWFLAVGAGRANDREMHSIARLIDSVCSALGITTCSIPYLADGGGPEQQSLSLANGFIEIDDLRGFEVLYSVISKVNYCDIVGSLDLCPN